MALHVFFPWYQDGLKSQKMDTSKTQSQAARQTSTKVVAKCLQTTSLRKEGERKKKIFQQLPDPTKKVIKNDFKICLKK